MTLGEKIHSLLRASTALDVYVDGRIHAVQGYAQHDVPSVIYAYSLNTDTPTLDDATDGEGEGLDETTVLFTCLARTAVDARSISTLVRNILRVGQVAGTFAVNLIGGPSETALDTPDAQSIHRADLTFRILHNLTI